MKTLQSHAKLNLGLRILGRRSEDGYHLLETIFQEIDLADEIGINEYRKEGQFHERFILTCENPEIPTDCNNLILKAVRAMVNFVPTDLAADIHLVKNIPSGAGLGGGSSNAATILKWLNKWAEFSDEDLAEIAVKLGADVPFFLKGGTQYAVGIGDELNAIGIPKDWQAVLVFPSIQISTAWAYEQLRISLTAKPKNTIISSQLEKAFDWRFFENEFDEAIIPSYPEIGEIKARLYEGGALYAGLSGSGSTVFGICKSCETAKKLRSSFKKAMIAKPL